MMLTLARNHQNWFVALKFEASQKYLLYCVSDFNEMFVFRVAFEEERLFTSDKVTQRCFMLGKEIKVGGGHTVFALPPGPLEADASFTKIGDFFFFF